MKVLTAVAILFVIFEVATAKFGHNRISYFYRYRRCDSKILYVCGNDGKNYVNPCVFHRAVAADKTKKLRKLYDGLCEDELGSLTRGVIFEPVCATNKNTYSNVIFMDLSACLTRRKIKVVSVGCCGSKCNFLVPKCGLKCPKIANPVCGDDGNTYASECVLQTQNCILGGKALKKVHNGPCKAAYDSLVGVESFSPVCGSDGNTYSSKTFVEVARCQNPHLRIKKYKACH